MQSLHTAVMLPEARAVKADCGGIVICGACRGNHALSQDVRNCYAERRSGTGGRHATRWERIRQLEASLENMHQNRRKRPDYSDPEVLELLKQRRLDEEERRQAVPETGDDRFWCRLCGVYSSNQGAHQNCSPYQWK